MTGADVPESSRKQYRVITQTGVPSDVHDKELERKLNEEAGRGFRVVGVVPIGDTQATLVIMEK